MNTEIHRLLVNEISSWRGMTTPIAPAQIDYYAARIEAVLASHLMQDATPAETYVRRLEAEGPAAFQKP